jgi:mRNA interferase MazF
MDEIRRGEIWWADLPEPRRSKSGHRRPVLVIQADSFNQSRIRTVIVAVITSSTDLADAPGNVLLRTGITGLSRDSVVNVSQLLTLDRGFLTEQVGVAAIATTALRRQRPAHNTSTRVANQSWRQYRCYSARSATFGSIRVARRAGK